MTFILHTLISDWKKVNVEDRDLLCNLINETKHRISLLEEKNAKLSHSERIILQDIANQLWKLSDDKNLRHDSTVQLQLKKTSNLAILAAISKKRIDPNSVTQICWQIHHTVSLCFESQEYKEAQYLNTKAQEIVSNIDDHNSGSQMRSKDLKENTIAMLKLQEIEIEWALQDEKGARLIALDMQNWLPIPKRIKTSMKFYNHGVDLYESGNFTACIFWIELSIAFLESSKDTIVPNDSSKKEMEVKLSRSLRVLSQCFLELDQPGKAKECIDKAILLSPDCSNYVQAIICAFKENDQSIGCELILHLLKMKECTLQIAIFVLQTAQSNIDLVISSLNLFYERWKDFKGILTIISFLLKNSLTIEELKKVISILEQVVKRAEMDSALNMQFKNVIFVIYKSVVEVQDRNLDHELLNRLICLFSDTLKDIEGEIKLRCLIALDHLGKNKPFEAKKILATIKYSDLSMEGKILQLLISLHMDEIDEITIQEKISDFINSDEIQAEHIFSLAVENTNFGMEKTALDLYFLLLSEKVSVDEELLFESLLSAIITFSKIFQACENHHNMIPQLQIILRNLTKFAELMKTSDSKILRNSKFVEAVKALWNILIICGRNNEFYPSHLLATFLNDILRLNFIKNDEGFSGTLELCTLLKCATLVEIFWQKFEFENIRNPILDQEKSEIAIHSLKTLRNEEFSLPAEKIIPLSYLLEFQLLLINNANDQALNSLIHDAFTSPGWNLKLAEKLANVCMQSPFQKKNLCQSILRRIVYLVCNSSGQHDGDCEVLANNYRKLFLISQNHQEAFEILQNIYETKFAISYPLDEAKWIISSTWNQGVYFYDGGRREEARSWITMAIKLHEKLLEGKFLHQKEMMKKALQSLQT